MKLFLGILFIVSRVLLTFSQNTFGDDVAFHTDYESTSDNNEITSETSADRPYSFLYTDSSRMEYADTIHDAAVKSGSTDSTISSAITTTTSKESSTTAEVTESTEDSPATQKQLISTSLSPSTTVPDVVTSDTSTSEIPSSKTTSSDTTTESETTATHNTAITTDTHSTNADTTTSTHTSRATEEPSTTPTLICKGNVVNISIVNDSSSINITWDAPKSDTQCVFSFIVFWNNTRNYTTADKLYMFTELYACTNYTFVIYTIYEKEVVGSTAEIVTSTDSTAPEAVKFNDLKVSSDSINITWTPEENTSNCIESYNVIIYRENKLVINITTQYAEFVENYVPFCTFSKYVVIPKPGGKENFLTYNNTKVNEAPKFLKSETNNDSLMTIWDLGLHPCKVDKISVDCIAENHKVTAVTNEIEESTAEVIFNLKDMKAYTKYTCCASVYNIEGKSEKGCSDEIKTPAQAPDPPKDLVVTEVNQQLRLAWKSPIKWNGLPLGITVEIENLGLNYTNICDLPPEKPQKIMLAPNMTEWISTFITACAKYNATVFTSSTGGSSSTVAVQIVTKNQIPISPTIHCQAQQKEFNETVILQIIPSCKTNGELKGFLVQVNGNRENYEEHAFSFNYTVDELKKLYQVELTHLRAEYNYKVDVSTLIEDYISLAASDICSMPAGKPVVEENSANWKEPILSDSDPTIATIQFSRDLFNASMGDILYYAIIVAEAGCEEDPQSDYYGEFWPSVKSKCSKTEAFTATPIKWKAESRTNMISFTLGTNTSKCQTDTEDNCNRPLKKNTNYTVKIRGFTKQAFTDTSLIDFMTGNDYVNIGMIVGVIVGILALASIIVIFLFYKNGSVNFKNWPKMKSVSEMSPAPLPISIKKFDTHFRAMTENSGRIQSEFQLLSTITSDVTNSTTTALLPVNKKKNRYVNILPYDETRVKLNTTDSTLNDYINASFIKGYSGNIEYIATQGPTDTTCASFWEMVIEKNVKLIVMLTQFVELGKEKCYRYFPDLKEELDFYNDIRIECEEEQLYQIYNRRIFKIKKQDISKSVTHIQYNLWPDFGVPTDVNHMLDFCDVIRDVKLQTPGLIVMHCSAGVGRTGTLIALDILLQAIRDKRKVDIFGTVLNLRKQRMNMVQSERQYEFLYKCVHQVILKKSNTSITQDLDQVSESNML